MSRSIHGLVRGLAHETRDNGYNIGKIFDNMEKRKDLACQQSTWYKFLLNRPWGKLPPPDSTSLSHTLPWTKMKL